jgi:hypothetical protein
MLGPARLPFLIAPLRHGFPVRLERAPHLRLWCMGNCFCMGLILRFWRTTPRLDVADDGLAAFMDVDVLDFDCLLSAASVSLQRLHLVRERPHKLVEGVLRAVLLRDGIDVGKPSGDRHRSQVHQSHLGSQHGFHSITRSYSRHDGKHASLRLQQQSHQHSRGFLTRRVVSVLPRVPIGFRRSRRLAAVHSASTVLHRPIPARLPGPPRAPHLSGQFGAVQYDGQIWYGLSRLE